VPYRLQYIPNLYSLPSGLAVEPFLFWYANLVANTKDNIVTLSDSGSKSSLVLLYSDCCPPGELHFSGVINTLSTPSCPAPGEQDRMFGGEDSPVYVY
jgi:hypothetical protein